MPMAIQRLIQRGYWDKAGEGADGSSSDAESGDGDNGNTGSDSDNGDSGDAEGDQGDDSPDKGDGEDSDGDKDSDKTDEEKARLLKDVMKKKEKIKGLEGQLSDIQAALKSFEALGLGADELGELVEAKRKAETEQLEKKGQWDKLREQMVSEHNKVLEAKDNRIAELEKALGDKNGIVEELTVGHAFDNSKFISEDLIVPPNKARQLYGSHFDIEDGKVVGYDKPRGVEGRVQLVGGDGNPLSFDKAFEKIIESDPDRDNMIRSRAKPGAGSKSQGKGAPVKSDKPQARGLSRIEAAVNKGDIKPLSK